MTSRLDFELLGAKRSAIGLRSLVVAALALGFLVLYACSLTETPQDTGIIHYRFTPSPVFLNGTNPTSMRVDYWVGTDTVPKDTSIPYALTMIPHIDAPLGAKLIILARVYTADSITGYMADSLSMGDRKAAVPLARISLPRILYGSLNDSIPWSRYSATLHWSLACDFGQGALPCPPSHPSTAQVQHPVLVYSDQAGRKWRDTVTLTTLAGVPQVLGDSVRRDSIGLGYTFVFHVVDDTSHGIAGRMVLWRWDFNGDGNWDDSTQVDSVHFTYPDTSRHFEYDVRMEAADDDGNKVDTSYHLWYTNDQTRVRFNTIGVLGDPMVNRPFRISAYAIDFDGNGIDSLWWDLNGDHVTDTVTASPDTMRVTLHRAASNDTVFIVTKDRWGLLDTTHVSYYVQPNRAPSVDSMAVESHGTGTTQPPQVTFAVYPYSIHDPDSNLEDTLFWHFDSNGVGKDTSMVFDPFAWRQGVTFAAWDSGTYAATVRLKDSLGLWSPVVSRSFHIDTAIVSTVPRTFSSGTYWVRFAPSCPNRHFNCMRIGADSLDMDVTGGRFTASFSDNIPANLDPFWLQVRMGSCSATCGS